MLVLAGRTPVEQAWVAEQVVQTPMVMDESDDITQRLEAEAPVPELQSELVMQAETQTPAVLASKPEQVPEPWQAAFEEHADVYVQTLDELQDPTCC